MSLLDMTVIIAEIYDWDWPLADNVNSLFQLIKEYKCLLSFTYQWM
jgi:hypothetical protein